MQIGKVRNHSIDNVRFLLIFFVVFAHLLEITLPYQERSDLYKVIYSFHMTVFIFITGYYAKLTPGKFIKTLLLLILFQFFYLLFDHYILHKSTSLIAMFTIPYWLLWYLLVLLFYMLLIPLINIKKENTIAKIIIVLVSIGLSIGASYIRIIGYVLSLQRFFTFLPYFIVGFYAKDSTLFLTSKKKGSFIIKVVNSLFIILSIYLIVMQKEITADILYGAKPNHKIFSNWAIELILYFIGLNWILFFTYTIKTSIKIPIVTCIGENTLPIYLLHGFIVRYIQLKGYLWSTNNLLLLYDILIACSILLLLGNKYFGKIFKTIFSFQFVDKIINKIKQKKDKKEIKTAHIINTK